MRLPEALRDRSLDGVVSVGGGEAGMPFQRHAEAWLALLHGRKLWCFCPPEHPPISAHKRQNLELVLNEVR